MDFKFSEEHIAFRDMAAEFARNRLAPNAEKWDEHSYFPIDILREAGSLGMGGILAAEDIGGANLNRLDAALIFEQLATGCITTSAYLSIHNMVASLVDHYAAEPLRSAWGPRINSLQALASYCLTEPDSGSDAASLKTRAVRDGEYYILNGAKSFISGGSVSDAYLCMVRTGDDSHHGISCILVEKDTHGLSFGK